MDTSGLALPDTSTHVKASSLRERLREETDAIHQSLHRNPGLQQLVSSQNSINLYQNVLKVFHRYYLTLDSSFNFVAPELRFPFEAKPLRWLAQDFSALGFEDDEHSPVLVLPDFILLQCMETYVGYLYVKQGSTLGGQAISRQLHKSLTLKPGETQFFFHGFGEYTGAYWKEFLQFIGQCEPDLDNDLVVAAAQTYFQLLDAAFKRAFPFGGINEK
jgi:heme oxygenase